MEVPSVYMNTTGQVPVGRYHKEITGGTTVDGVKGPLVTMRLSTVAVLAVALLVIGAACGSDEASSAAAPDSLDTDRFDLPGVVGPIRLRAYFLDR